VKKNKLYSFIFFFLLGIFSSGYAQDMVPRAYAWIPKNTTTVISAFNFSEGDIVTDATLPVDNVNANVKALL
jgi:hypothetical protein